jgi:alginate O-acetyltransferase complex protein AlgI
MAFVPIYILILFLTIIIDYFAGILIEKSSLHTHKKLFLIASLFVNVGILAIFKYYNFFIDNLNAIGKLDFPLINILLPIGLSFHTFQAMSYTIEVYRGNQPAERHVGIYALYVMFYPQLVAGPIERPQNILHQLHERKSFKYENIANGMKLMAWGMFKKVVVADRLAIYVNQVFDNNASYEGIPVIIACIFFALQIYFDFSGYSDIALGSAKTLGFDLMLNFNKPYFSLSVAEFWSRWHISLSTWFKDYLYIPLGGNRASYGRTVLNRFFVFAISGLWHGANFTFIVWGFLHGLFISIEAFLKKSLPAVKLSGFIKRVLILFFITIAWVFFRAPTIKTAFQIIGSIFRNIPNQISAILTNQNFQRLQLLYVGKEKSVLTLCVLFAALIFYIEWRQKSKSFVEHVATFNKPLRYVTYFFLIYGSIFLGVFETNQFIYFQF